MTKIRALLPLWLVVLTVSVMLASAGFARADEDEGNDNIWFGESVSGDAPSQSNGPDFWGTVRSLLGLGETRRETPLNAAREEEPATEKAAVSPTAVQGGESAAVKENSPIPSEEVRGVAQPERGEESAEQPGAGNVAPVVEDAVTASPRQETQSVPVEAAPESPPVARPGVTGAEPRAGDSLSSAAEPSDGVSVPPVQESGVSAESFGQDYVVGPGDQLGISVWRDDMLTKTVLVLPDGKITYPLIGEMVVGGKSLGDIKKELTNKLATYVVDADISVEVKQSNSLFIYIIGRVNAPGRQMLLANTTVLQALAMAGGLNPFADEDDIKVFRREKEKTLMYRFRYSHVAEGKHLEDNILLKRGDVIFIP